MFKIGDKVQVTGCSNEDQSRQKHCPCNYPCFSSLKIGTISALTKDGILASSSRDEEFFRFYWNVKKLDERFLKHKERLCSNLET